MRNYTFTKSNTENILEMAENINLRKTVENITDVDISDDRAIVRFELNENSLIPEWGGEKDMRIILVREDAEWKVDTIVQVKYGE